MDWFKRGEFFMVGGKFKESDRERIVLMVNELHHDLNDKYHSSNKTMHASESENWKGLLKRFDMTGKSVCEIGTGTGFVPLLLIKNGVHPKEYFCTDISQNILGEAKKRINAEKGRIDFKYVLLRDKMLPFKNRSFDFMIMNSVLHHLPDIDVFFLEANRCLKEKGILIIAHEPNKKFFESILLKTNLKIIYGTTSSVGKIISAVMRKKKDTSQDDAINKALIKKGLIKEPLTHTEILSFIDYHAKKGIDYKKYPKRFFSLKHSHTYNYLGAMNFAFDNITWRIFANTYDRAMSKLYPEKGGTYLAVYEKRRGR
jgi:ubiquinone/menaquinone biosynthesis C-methylase UbiE